MGNQVGRLILHVAGVRTWLCGANVPAAAAAAAAAVAASAAAAVVAAAAAMAAATAAANTFAEMGASNLRARGDEA